jgi:hypothetical protein
MADAFLRRATTFPYLNPARRVSEALARLIHLYEAWGKPAQAAEWRKKLEVFSQGSQSAEKQGL